MTNTTQARTPGPFHLWQCDDGSFDIVDESVTGSPAVAYQNIPEPVARAFVAHAQLVADKAALIRALRALKAVNVAITCNEAQGGDLGKRINRSNPLTVEAVRAALAAATGE